MDDRRRLLARSAAVAALLGMNGWLPAVAQAAWNAAAFRARNLAEAVDVLGGAAPRPGTEVSLQAPDIAEDGGAVPLAVSVAGLGARRLLLLIDRNPNPLAAVFELGEALEPAFRVNVKMGRTATVYAAAMMADGRVLYAAKEVRIVLGGCG